VLRQDDGIEFVVAVPREVVPFGKYWRRRPFVFSFVRVARLCGSQK